MKSLESKGKWIPLILTLVYASLGIFWIFFSDFWLDSYLENTKSYVLFQNVKGILAIFFSAVVLYFCFKHFSEKELLASRDRLQLLNQKYQYDAIAAHLNSGLFIFHPDQNSTIFYANSEFEKLTGYSMREIKGKSFWVLIDEREINPGIIEKFNHAVTQKESLTIELKCCRKDGTYLWNEWSLNPIFGEQNNILFFIVFQNDITKRKMDEKKLLESEQRYKSLFEHNPEIVCACDLRGFVIKANPAVYKITGYPVEEVIGCNYRNFIDEEEWESARLFFRKVLRGRPQIGQFQVRDIEGNSVDLEAVVMPIVVDGKIEGMYTIAKDVTKYNKAQDLLKKAEKLNVVGELAAGIAHEIRNPLTSLKGFVQLLRPSLTDKRAYTDVMLSELERIEQIVTELLLLAKPQPVQFEKKELRALLEHVCTLLNTKAIMSNIEISLNYQCEMEKIYCEENQLKQVLINLLKNAIEAMPDGGHIRLEAENANQDEIMIRLIDHGSGIPEESLEKLGEPFYTTKEQGTGLGLMISSKIIREHGGTMKFKSKEGEGTTVEIQLPVMPKVSKKTIKNYQISG